MIYILLCAFVLMTLWLSYNLIKTYQLCGYNVGKFLDNCLKLNFSIGDKNRLVVTKRIIRFIIALTLFYAGLFFLPLTFVHNIFFVILDCLVIVVALPFWIVIVHYICFPLEEIIKCCYIHAAKRKLSKKSVIKIGITGSYGKTSVKNILAHILEKEYKVCATPKNYNTEMGTTITILKNLDDHDVFIAEMGARKPRDIEKLTKIVMPDIGIITSVGNCHIESFKSVENVENTKFELAANLPAGGQMFFSLASQSCEKLYKRFTGSKFAVCKENCFAYAQNEKVSAGGSSFDLVIDGKLVPVQTRLLGKFNIDNIVLAAAVAYKLGVSLEDIVAAVKSLDPTPHRLQLIKNGYSYVLDDSYNSNEVGFSEALNVLSQFEGRKIVVTPGMVELGACQNEINFKLGGMVADACDYFIIMNNANKNELLSGAISHGFKKEHIFFASTRKEQTDLIKLLSCKDCVILFENDLPDNYE